MALCEYNIDKIKAAVGLAEKLSAVFSGHAYSEKDSDPDLSIYSGGFFSDADRQKMAKIRASSPEQLAKSEFKFKDPRLPEMLFRYRARNYPETLSSDEQLQMERILRESVEGRQAGAGITLDAYFARLQELRGEKNSNVKSLMPYMLTGLSCANLMTTTERELA